MTTYKKNIRQYATSDQESVEELRLILERCQGARNHIFQRFSGINSISKVNNSSVEIRDKWTESGFLDTWSIPRRYARACILDATSNIRSMWSNLKLNIKKKINCNENLSSAEKHYIRYVLKINELYEQVLSGKVTYEFPNTFDSLDKRKLNKYICSITRNLKPNISKSHSFMVEIDQEMYRYDKDGNILITGLNSGKRLKFMVNTVDRFKGNIRIQIKGERIIISRAIEAEVKEPVSREEKIIGVDKNFINAFDTSNDNSFGKELNKVQMEFSTKLSEKNKKRTEYKKRVGNKEDIDKFEKKKIDNIRKNNLGTKKYDKLKNKHKEQIKTKVNEAVNKLIKTENPTEVVVEDLSFSYKKGSNKKAMNKKVKMYLGNWMKGYMDQRLSYKCFYNNVSVCKVNPAYTSQTCHKCKHFGVRKNDMFYCNMGCEVVSSGYNASKVVLQRRDDKEITLKMSPQEVKRIIEKRLLDLKTEPTKTTYNLQVERIKKKCLHNFA